MGVDLKIPVDLNSSAAFVRVQRLRAYLSAEYHHQAQQKFLYLPIILSFGIAIYFALPIEPPLVVGVFAVALAVFARAMLAPRYGLMLGALLIVATGFFAGQVRTHLTHTPVLQKELRPVMVVGTISALQDLGDDEGARLILSDIEIEDLEPSATPSKIRLKSRNDEGLHVGQRIEALSSLRPPSTPIMPGGFDFQRHLYFKGIGAVGFIYRDIHIVEDVSTVSFQRTVEQLRQDIGARIERVMPYPQTGVAMALTIGRKTAIAKPDQEAMRAAGLAHMLAISGLHVGLFSGALFFVVRLFLVCIPGLALHYPVKKWVAVIAILGALTYMFLAGASIPTQRAMVMTGIVFLAIILDRSPISLRLVAFAAFMVLLLFPESLLSASFHMSFSAVTCLIAFYGWLRPYWSSWHRQTGALRRAGLYFLGVSLTTVVATFATAPFSLFHFQTLAVYSILGNLVAVPLLAFLIMPSILLSLALMPLGLEGLPLIVTEIGVGGVLDIAHWVGALPGAVLRLPIWSGSALVAFVFAGFVVILMRGWLRALCVVPLMLSAVLAMGNVLPDIVISDEAKLIGVRTAEGLYVSSFSKDRFVRGRWGEVFGFYEGAVHRWPKEGVGSGGGEMVRCGEMACRITVGGVVVSYVKAEEAALEECESADAVIANFPLRKLCGWETKTRLIDLFDTKKNGAHALWIKDGEITLRSSGEVRGLRAWSAGNGKFRSLEKLEVKS